MSTAISSSVVKIFRRFGSRTTVSDNPVAHLMYYMHCIDAVLDLDHEENIAHLTDYDSYLSMSQKDVDQLLDLCEKYNPGLLENRCIYQNDAMCIDTNNEFYEITEAQSHLAALHSVSTTVAVGSQTVTVSKIMCYEKIWMEKHYTRPISYMQPWVYAKASNAMRPVKKCNVRLQPKNPFPTSGKFSDNIGANVLMSYFLPVWIFGWIIMRILQS